MPVHAWLCLFIRPAGDNVIKIAVTRSRANLARSGIADLARMIRPNKANGFRLGIIVQTDVKVPCFFSVAIDELRSGLQEGA